MKTIGVIPSRIGSERFPEKPLSLIAGKPLLQWVIEGVQTSKRISQILVATDDKRIADLSEKLGVQAIMTPSEIPTGTDRIFKATQEIDCDLILNIQGDEPLVTGDVLDLLILEMEKHSSSLMGTLAHPFKNSEDYKNPNRVKVLVDNNSEAIYFSRLPIPFSRKEIVPEKGLSHIGIYAYRKEFLKTFCDTPATDLEKSEGLEQLRALQLGERIRVVTTDYETYGVDTPSDVKLIEKIIRQRGLM